MMNTLSTNYPELSARHKANIAASLAHRLDRARATRNFQLLTLLEQEQQQLIQSEPTQQQQQQQQTAFTNPIQWGKAVWFRLVDAIANSSRISIKAVTMSDSGAVIWRAYDPTTGETRYAETEADLIDWIEAQRYGSGVSEISYSRAAKFRHIL